MFEGGNLAIDPANGRADHIDDLALLNNSDIANRSSSYHYWRNERGYGTSRGNGGEAVGGLPALGTRVRTSLDDSLGSMDTGYAGRVSGS